jgi:hypothetical protein
VKSPGDPPRPATSAGIVGSSGLQGKRNRSDTGVSRKPVPNVSYSLTPAITPSHSRRASRATIAKSISSKHQRSASQSTTRTVDTVATIKACPPSRKGQEKTILDEVEGTLSATITELQELQAGWQSPELTPTPSDASTNGDKNSTMSSPSKLNEEKSDDYFAVRPPSRKGNDGLLAPEAVPTLPGSQSLPPTPLNAIHPLRQHTPDPRLQALEQAYDSQKRKAHSIYQENEVLKKQLHVALKRIAESDAIRNERDKYERELKEAKQKLEASSEDLNTTKLLELASKNKLESIEARLVEAQEQKVDVLEANHDLRQKMSKLQKEMAELSKEISDLRERPEKSALGAAEARCREIEERNKHLEEQVKASNGRVDLPTVVADLTFKLEDAQRVAKEHESHVAALETRNQATLKDMEHLKSSYSKLAELNETLQDAESSNSKLVDTIKTSTAQINELQQKLAGKEQAAKIAATEKEKFQQLLHAEFRRSAVEMYNRKHPTALGSLEKRMDIEATFKDIRRRAEEAIQCKPVASDTDIEQQLKDLEQEISYHLTDILLYKLDVKGYKKDLRKAQAKIQDLQSQNQQLTQRLSSEPSASISASALASAPNNSTNVSRERGPSVSSTTSTGSPVPALSSVSSGIQPEEWPATPRAVFGVATPIPLAGAVMITPDDAEAGPAGLGLSNGQPGGGQDAMALTVPSYMTGGSHSKDRSRSRSPVHVVNVKGHGRGTSASGAAVPTPSTTGHEVGVVG